MVLKLNLISIKDYICLRNNHCFSNVAFQYVKHLHINKDGKTFWQALKEIDNEYDERYEPSLTTLNKLIL